MVFTLSNFLIVGQQIGPDPGFWICLTQAGLIYAAPVLCVHVMIIIGSDSALMVFCLGVGFVVLRLYSR